MNVVCMICGKGPDKTTLGMVGINIRDINFIVVLCRPDYNQICETGEIEVQGRKIPVMTQEMHTKLERQN